MRTSASLATLGTVVEEMGTMSVPDEIAKEWAAASAAASAAVSEPLSAAVGEPLSEAVGEAVGEARGEGGRMGGRLFASDPEAVVACAQRERAKRGTMCYDKRGYFHNAAGKRPAVVHQYNRVPEMVVLVLARYGKHGACPHVWSESS